MGRRRRAPTPVSALPSGPAGAPVDDQSLALYGVSSALHEQIAFILSFRDATLLEHYELWLSARRSCRVLLSQLAQEAAM